MLFAYSSQVIRQAEAPLIQAAPLDALMKDAAAAVVAGTARALRSHGYRLSGSTILLLVGPGNNGGDALYAGAGLARRGASVRAALLCNQVHERAAAAAVAAGVQMYPVADGSGCEDSLIELATWAGVWIDGLLGLGSDGRYRDPLSTWIAELALLQVSLPVEPMVIAVDLPSGMSPDSGELQAPVLQATHTISFGGAKPGLLLPPARALAGKLEVVDIGLHLGDQSPKVAELTRADVADLWPVPVANDHKYSRGVVGICAGTARYPGAGILACSGALGAGVGMARYLGPVELQAQVLQACPEAVLVPGRMDAAVVGPGIDPHDTKAKRLTRAVCQEIKTSGGPVVVDAGALSLLPESVPENWVLTPHTGEILELLQRLAPTEQWNKESIAAGPENALRRAVELTGATVLLKGETTLVQGPKTPIFVVSGGDPTLATAGTGDVLAGLLGAVLAAASAIGAANSGMQIAQLAAAAAWIHAQASHITKGPLRAMSLAAALPQAIRYALGKDE